MNAHLMSGDLNTDPPDHLPLQPGTGDSFNQQTDEVNGDVYLSKAERSAALDQRSLPETSIKTAPSRTKLSRTCSAPELRNAGTSTAGPSIQSRRDAVEDTANAAPLSPLDKDGLPPKEPPSRWRYRSGWEVVRTSKGEIYFADHDTRSTTWRDPWQIPDSFASDLTAEHEDLSRPLPKGWVKGWSKSGQSYFTDPQTKHTTRWDPRMFIKQLPFSVMVHAERDGALELSYERFGKRWSVIWKPPYELLLSEIVQILEELKTTADRLQDALDIPDTVSDFPRAVAFTHEGRKEVTPEAVRFARHRVTMVENVNLSFIRAIAEYHGAFLKPLIKHISRRNLPLANTVTEQLLAFEKAWGRFEGLNEHRHWDAACTWEQGIDRSDFHPVLTFLPELPSWDDRMWENRAYCRVSFMTSPLFRANKNPQLLVLIDSPDPPAHPFVSARSIDDLPPGARMPICMHDFGKGRVTFFDSFSGLLHRSFDSCVSHNDEDSWASNVINSMSSGKMQWTVVCYAWEIHLIHLRDAIEYTERMGLDEPNVGSLRQINGQRRHVQQAVKDIDRCLEVLQPVVLDHHGDHMSQSEPHKNALREIRASKEKLTAIKQDINDTTTLVIGAISVMDAGDSRIQARRATALTALAAIYLPLSLATGVFGMNIWEINSGSPRWWAVLALGFGLLGLSLPFLAWVFIDKGGTTQNGHLSSLAIGYDTSRLERGLAVSSDVSPRSGKEKPN